MPGPNTLLDKAFQLYYNNAYDVNNYPPIFNVVKVTGTGAAGALPQIKLSTASNEKVLGVVQEDTPIPSSALANGKDYAALGRYVNVRILGITRVVATGVIAVGSRVISNGDGTVVIATAATANQNIVGIAMGAAAATGDQIDLLLTPGMQAYAP